MPSMNWTLPVGTAEVPEAFVTVAVSVTELPKKALRLLEVTAVEVLALLTVIDVEPLALL